CTTVGATGECTAVITSSQGGTTTVKAATSVSVSGVTLNRATGDGKAGDSPNATKTWRNVSVVTTVLDANNNDVTGTSVPANSVLHDKVVVTGTPGGGPAPSGN